MAAKLHFSAVAGGCHELEEAGGPGQYVVCGMETHVCVLQTVIELLELGKKVFLVEEAVGSRRDTDKALALARMREAGASIVSRVMNEHERDLVALGRNIEALAKIQKPFPRLHHKEAVALINKAIQDGTADTRPAGSERKAEGTEEAEAERPKRTHLASEGSDFGGDDETILTRMYDRPVMVHRYPQEVKAFYMKRDPKDDTRALGVDVLAPEGYGEIVGGGQREESLETLLSRIDHHQLSREDFAWYTDLRRFGTVPHSGFGLGVERSVAWLCGLHHVRETNPFPRMLERLSP
jgi:asparaginyl-tRNA synthetase